jgi:16S rRNA (guanine(966)-N(2))-methyltransferase RsmD
MMKQAVFNILQQRVTDARVLDLFCGTGQLGVEALSRGAAFCVFNDSAPASVELAKRNAAAARVDDRAKFIRSDALEYIKKRARREDGDVFDIIFIDPPYDSGLLDAALEKIIEFDILKEYGIIVCESRAGHIAPDAPPPYKMLREYKYGGAKITLYTKESDV